MQTTLAIPDGSTALLSGWTTERQVAHESGPPVLTNIPYVNRLFKNVGYSREKDHVLVLVTPRIVVHAEEEQTAPPHALIRTGCSPATGGLACEAIEMRCVPPPAKAHVSDPSIMSQKKLAKLLEKYHQACVEGRLEDAKKLARRALTLDPACFDKQDYAK
jgi:hypothetical protein